MNINIVNRKINRNKKQNSMFGSIPDINISSVIFMMYFIECLTKIRSFFKIICITRAHSTHVLINQYFCVYCRLLLYFFIPLRKPIHVPINSMNHHKILKNLQKNLHLITVLLLQIDKAARYGFRKRHCNLLLPEINAGNCEL